MMYQVIVFVMIGVFGIQMQASQASLTEIKPASRLDRRMIAAAQTGRLENLQQLLKNGANVNAQSVNQITALGYAAWNGNKDVILVLLDAGADVNIKNNKGQTFESILREMHPELLSDVDIKKAIAKQLLFSKKEVKRSVENNIHSVIAGIAKNEKNSSQPTSVDYEEKKRAQVMQASPVAKAAKVLPSKIDQQMLNAAETHQLQNMQELIKKGANIDAKNIQGQTALMLAVINNDEKIVKALIEAGADLDIQGKNKRTTLMHAARKGNKNTIVALLKAGADSSV